MTDTTVQCTLCPNACQIAPGACGDCRIRYNIGGVLRSVTYGFPCAVHVDPVEKKPVYHFLPGTKTFSLATVGCNFHCVNCQNWEISQATPEHVPAYELSPSAVAEHAQRHRCNSISMTYSEPLVWYEYTLDICRAAHASGLKSVVVTNGYINQEPLRTLLPWVDAIRIDLKAMSDEFYRIHCGGRLAPVLASLVTAKELKRHVEVVHLVIPTLNDQDTDLTRFCRWMHENMGADTPLHFSRFVPQYRLRNLPPTPFGTLSRARAIAQAEGLHHVYIGNVTEPDTADTHCPTCKRVLIRRRGYQVIQNVLTQQSRCPDCNDFIEGVWQ